jgi:hypothetical protein
MNLQNINTKTYVLTPAAASSSITFPAVPAGTKIVVYNDSTLPAFVVSGATAPTAVFPTSGAAKEGKVVPSGAMVTFELNVNDAYLATIQKVAGVGDLYFTVGEGV